MARHWSVDGHDVTFMCAAVEGQLSEETHPDGCRIVRGGSRLTVYRHARLKVLGMSIGPDVVLDVVNTRPYLTPKWCPVPAVALVHQLAADVWPYEVPAPAAMLGRHVLEALGMTGVHLRGRVAADERWRLMASAHAIVATAVREGWGLTISEAALVGTRAVGYDVPGLRDSVTAAEGVLVAPSPAALAEALAEHFRSGWPRVQPIWAMLECRLGRASLPPCSRISKQPAVADATHQAVR